MLGKFVIARRLDDDAGLRDRLLDLILGEHLMHGLGELVDELLGRGTCPSTGESARRTQVVMDRVLSTFYGGREDEFWNRPSTWPGISERAPAR